MTDQETPEKANPEFKIERFYTKSSSFDIQNIQEIFKQEWRPEAKIEMQVKLGI